MLKLSGICGFLPWNRRRTRLVNPPKSIAIKRLNRLRSGSNLAMTTSYWALYGPRLVGTAGFYREPRQKRHHKGWIWGVFVVAQYRGKGIARALITAVLEEARGLPGLRKVHLSVTTDQEQARKLYSALGFRSYGLEPEALSAEGRYLDEEFMFLDL